MYINGIKNETTSNNTAVINNLLPGSFYEVQVYSKSNGFLSKVPANGSAYTSNLIFRCNSAQYIQLKFMWIKK